MSGSMTGLYVGASGLQASQNGLNTTSHNIANADTKGYTRQQVLLSDAYYQTIGTSTTSKMQVGYGVTVERVRQIRNEFLDSAYRKETGRQGFYEAQYNAVSETEDIFGETEGVSFKESIDSLWKSISELKKEPDNIVARSTLVSSADAFIKRAQIISTQLSNYQVSLNTEVKTNVDKINSLADQINDTNKQIKKVESTGVERANDLRDSRNLLLDQLSEITDITYKETAGGDMYVYTEGHALISDGDVNHMYVEPMSETSDMYNVKWEGSKSNVFNFDLVPSSERGTDVGYLKGLMLARGDDKANYTNIPGEEPDPADYATTADYDTAKADYDKKLKYYNDVVSNSTIMTAQAQFDKLVNGIVTAINDVFCPKTTMTVGTTTYTILDLTKAPVGMDVNSTVGNGLFNRRNMETFEKIDLNGDGKDEYVYQESDEADNYSLYTIEQLEVNQDIQKAVTLIPLSKTGGTGDVDIDAADKLLDIWNKDFTTLDPNSLTKYTFYEYYTAFIGDIANRGEIYNTVSSSQETLVNDIESQRQAIAGVSTDEELTNLIKYQHAYNAASRYINVVSQMIEDIVTKL
jgi:flagellar hook-associated protein 1 FlgK